MRSTLLVVYILFISIFTSSLLAVISQSVTTGERGISEFHYTEMETSKSDLSIENFSFETTSLIDNRAGVNWNASHYASIVNGVAVSSVTQNSIVEWVTNQQKLSLHNDSSTPVWEHQVGNIIFDYPMDMTEDGSVIAIGDEETLKIFSPDSSTPTWELVFDYKIIDLKLSPDGSSVYLTYTNSATDTAIVEHYQIGSSEPLWNYSISGECGYLSMSGDGSTLLLTLLYVYDSVYVIDSSDGSLIMSGLEQNQLAPKISHDASIIITADNSGVLTVYEYNEGIDNYVIKWTYPLGGDDWIFGMNVSADGSTISVGTIIFTSAGYDGDIYLFDTSSSTPMWIYEGTGDEVVDIDLSDDGSLIAVATYGPLDHSKPDFFLFNKNSSAPIFTINTEGSFFAVDISGDGTLCTVGGKAVHARVTGAGGIVYNIDCNYARGSINGIVNLEDEDDNSGVRVDILEIPNFHTYSDYDGNFSLTDIPIGNYSIELSKEGYTSVTIDDIEITDGIVVELDEIELLQETGIDDNYQLSVINYQLKQNYPNPFNPVTKINYELGITNYEKAEIVIHNAMGQSVWSTLVGARSSCPALGTTNHGSILFDGSKFNSGIYYYSLIIDGKQMDTKSMVLIK